ncbi:nitroreductase/quinone reductase family protein [Streptomyces bambusae]|uniref:nitroreductase/quinone reductase family protein n=1 Tax=Streptomyces bambusae TaxID=1550616 RepID=UPI001CFD1917|nr:nitroreductase/quinone reductase family protein [Streptomyces bambusae]MCB5164205.1 nitroreductase/quinone reductase family protein [Streptomyces bambusae]
MSTESPDPAFADFNQRVIEEFRAGGGKVGGPFEGGDLLLLTTVGARSGTEHTVPLGYVRDGGVLFVIGSAGGADRHPAWYHNLLAHPMVRVELGTEEFEAVAVPAEGEQHARLFAAAVRTAPGYGDYQRQTRRVLPVVMLQSAGVQAQAAATNMAEKLVEIHGWLRAQLGHVRDEATAHFAARAAHRGKGAPPAPGLGLQLRQHCLAFCESLEFHHTAEDAHVFPALEAQYAHLAAPLARLREEHRTVARIKAELLALLGGIAESEAEPFLADLDRMARELTAHLDYEEESLIPVLAEIPFPPAGGPGGPGGPGGSGAR